MLASAGGWAQPYLKPSVNDSVLCELQFSVSKSYTETHTIKLQSYTFIGVLIQTVGAS